MKNKESNVKFYTFCIIATVFLFSNCSNNPTFVSKPFLSSLHFNATTDKPVENFKWNNWFLSVPIDRGNGKALSIYHKDIASGNFTDEQKKYVQKNHDGSYTFKTSYTGITGNSAEKKNYLRKFSGTELREYWRGNQSSIDNWSMSSGTHRLASKMKIQNCQGSKKTYVAQIMGAERNNPSTVKVAWDQGEIKIEYLTKPTENNSEWSSKFTEQQTIARVDHEIFTVQLKIDEGKLSYSLSCPNKNIDTGFKQLYDYTNNGYNYSNYFKTGNYFSWNKDTSASCELRLLSVKTDHE